MAPVSEEEKCKKKRGPFDKLEKPPNAILNKHISFQKKLKK